MADLVKNMSNTKKQTLKGDVMTDFITPEELTEEIVRFEAEMRNLLESEFGEVLDLKMSHKKIDNSDATGKNQYTLTYEANINGEVIELEKFQEQMESLIDEKFPDMSMVKEIVIEIDDVLNLQKQSLCGAILTDFISLDELAKQVKDFEAEMQTILKTEFGEVLDLKISHREVMSGNGMTSKKQYMILYEAQVNGKTIILENFEAKLESTLQQRLPQLSVVKGSMVVERHEDGEDAENQVSKGKATLDFNQLDKLVQKSLLTQKSRRFSFGGCYVSTVVPVHEISTLKASFDQIVYYIIQQSIGTTQFKIETSLVDKPIYECLLGQKRALTYCVEVFDSVNDSMVVQINTLLDQYVSHSLPQLTRLKSADFHGSTPVELNLFDKQVENLTSSELSLQEVKIKKSVLLTTSKMSYDAALSSLPQLKAQFYQLLSSYGDIDLDLTILNDPTDVDQEFTLELSVGFTGKFPSDYIQTIQHDLTQKLSNLGQTSSLIQAAHAIDSTQKSKAEIEKMRRKLVQSQKPEKVVCEMVLTTPEMPKSELHDYIKKIETIISNQFSQLGIKSETTVQILNPDQDNGRFVLQCQSTFYGETININMEAVKNSIEEQLPGLEVFESQISKGLQGSINKMKSSVAKATQKALERVVNEKVSKENDEKKAEEIKLKAEEKKRQEMEIEMKTQEEIKRKEKEEAERKEKEEMERKEKEAKANESDESECDGKEDSSFTISNELEIFIDSIEDAEQNKNEIANELKSVLSDGSLGHGSLGHSSGFG